MTTNVISTYLKHANLQMAAEAILPYGFTGAIPKDALKKGNNHSSRFTDAQAQQFIDDGWVVVEHKTNTATGFSGTLFRNSKTNELVLSLRSTEFIDDAARDNQATNALEIKALGWAFGQIADMRAWVDSLYASGKIGGQDLYVTGYSLGAHLATAFNMLYQLPGEVDGTYTFNGAGVGRLENNVGLQTTISRFNDLRSPDGDLSSLFDDPNLKSLYQSLRSTLKGGGLPTAAQRDAIAAITPPKIPMPPLGMTVQLPFRDPQAQMLVDAFNRVDLIQKEMARVADLSSGYSNGGPQRPLTPAASEVEATNINYQLAVLTAAKNTSAIGVVQNGYQAVFGRLQAPVTYPNFFDIYGYTSPSAVSNSQLHYGQAAPIFIEDQPLLRGNVVLEAAQQYYAYHDVKLLVDGYAKNDFGDTHSLVLLVDSLSVQDALARLAPMVTPNELLGILNGASNSKADTDWTGGGQGRAEGDVLERVVDALYRIFKDPKATSLDTSDLMKGGTWAAFDPREVFHKRLNDITGSSAFKAVEGSISVNVQASGAGLAGLARKDFGALAALQTLSPVSITGKDDASASALSAALGTVWGGGTYTDWKTDKDMSKADREARKEVFTQQYFDDRASMVRWLVMRNQQNSEYVQFQRPSHDAHFKDVKSGIEFEVGPNQGAKRQIVFGSDDPDALTGATLNDHIYGGGGTDALTGGAGDDYLEGNADSDHLYGGDGNDTLLGGKDVDYLYGEKNNDRLYGGDGDDELYGDVGDDTLAGGDEKDKLEGGDGKDILRGGDKDDKLTGGKGDDRLEGGKDFDTYIFADDFGHDVIEDSDGKGVIRVDGVDLPATAKKLAPGVHESEDKQIRYEISGSNLIVKFAGKDKTITIRNWVDGQLGITLDPTPVPVTPTTATFTGESAHNSEDFLVGTAGADLFDARVGNDLVIGRDGDDVIEAGEGADLIAGGLGADQIRGGAGADWIYGSGWGTWLSFDDPAPVPDGAITIARGYGWAVYKEGEYGTPYVTGVFVDPMGGDQPNVIDGGAGDDHIDSGFSDDVAHGGADNDLIYGLWGADLLFGDEGNDVVFGDGVVRPGTLQSVPGVWHGNDVLDGGAGVDNLFGDGGDDEVYGGDGKDYLYGDQSTLNRHILPKEFDGNDYLEGGAGEDWMEGGQRDDVMFGGTENDAMFGDGTIKNEEATFEGQDYLDGEEGDDEIIGGGNDDTLFGGDGRDKLFGDATADSSNQGMDYLDGEAGDDEATGGGNDDTLFGGAGKDKLFGDDINDVVEVSLHGNDYLDGEEDDDELTGGGKDDELFGGDGDDVLRGDNDVEYCASSSHGADYLDGGAGDDDLLGDGGDDTLVGGDGNDFLAGEDQLNAGDTSDLTGNDALYGGAGSDTLIGGSGNDTLDGGADQDYLEGGAGDDTYVIRAQDVPVVDGGVETINDNEGSNTLLFASGGPSRVIPNGSNGALALVFDTDHAIVLENGLLGGFAWVDEGLGPVDFSSWLQDKLGSSVTVTATQVNQTVHGGGADDSLNSIKLGTSFEGGWGNDILSGGGGKNTYKFRIGDGVDSITDTSPKSFAEQTPAPPDVLSFGRGVDADRWHSAEDFAITFQHWGSRPRRPAFELRPMADIAAPNRVLFGAGIASSDLKLTHDGAFVVQVGPWGDAVRINGFDASNTSAFTAIDYFEFENGDVLSYAQLLAQGFDYTGTADADTIDGTDVVDRFAASAGNDILKGGAGSDVYGWSIGSGQDMIDDGDAGVVSADTLTFAAGLTPVDVILNRSGDDLVVRSRSTTDTVTVAGHFAGRGIESMVFDGGPTWSAADIAGRITNELTEGSDSFVGTANADFIDARGGNDTVQGAAGDDTIDGGSGDDTLHGDDGADTVLGSAGNDWQYGEAGDDLLIGGAGTDMLNGGAGNDTFKEGESMYGGAGSDTFVIGAGTEPYVYEYADASPHVDALVLPGGSTPSTVELYRWFNNLSGWYDDLVVKDNGSASGAYLQSYYATQNNDNKVEEIRLGDGTVWNVQDVMARDRDNQITEISDTLLGHRWSEVIDGKGGGDYIKGGPGDDTIRGGAGDDQIYGDDEYAPTRGWTEGNDVLDGGAGNDTLDGGGGNDSLDGGAGNDRLVGDLGNDLYALGRGLGSDTLSDAGGTDEIALSSGVVPADVTLFRIGSSLIVAMDNGATQHTISGQFDSPGTEIESIRFADGTVWDAAAIAANAISGTPDAMTGTPGDDTFVVDNNGDTISEGANQGIDTVQSSIPYALGFNLENLTLTGYLNNHGYGNTLDNVLTGNAGHNVLRGHDGKDTLYGGGGDDTLWANSDTQKDDDQVDLLVGGAGDDRYDRVASSDQIIEQAGEGTDTINLTADEPAYTMPDNVENLTVGYTRYAFGVTLTGNALNNVITADPNTTGYVLDGGTGADTLVAGIAGATFVVDNTNDLLVSGGIPSVGDWQTGGVDKVKSSVDWTLGAVFEKLELLGTAPLHGVGNDLSNEIRGNTGDNILEGRGGNDDLYAGDGADTLIGGDGNDTLRDEVGRTGLDTMVGGKGDDVYRWLGGSVVLELAGEGDDTLIMDKYATAYGETYLMSSFANVENMSLTVMSNNANVIGNDSANRIIGNTYDNRLEGGVGNDAIFDSGAVGTDADILLGSEGHDTLTSYGGADVLDGGAGDDLLVSSGNVTIGFGLGYGADLWNTQGTGSTRRVLFGLGVTPGEMQLTRSGSDLKIAVSSSDVLTITGFFIDETSSTPAGLLGYVQFADGVTLDANALVTRLANNNTNIATAGDDLLLGSTGADTFSGMGGNDAVYGSDGDDVLSGDAGNDDLQGGFGSDTYRFASGDGQDVIKEAGGNGDAVEFAGGVLPSDVKVTRSGNDLMLAVGVAGDQITVRGFFAGAPSELDAVRFSDSTVWDAAMLKSLASTIVGTPGDDDLTGATSDDEMYGLAGNDRLDGRQGNDLLDGGTGDDALIGGEGNDTFVIDSTGDVVTEYEGQGTDTALSSVTCTLGSYVENLTLTGAVAIDGTGNALANVIIGNTANNVLNGGALDDTMVGGADNDTYVVDSTADVVTENAGEGMDVVQSSATFTLSSDVENLTLTGTAAINGTGNALDNVLTGNSAANVLTGGAGNDTYVTGAGDTTAENANEGIDAVQASATATLGNNVENLTLTGTSAINGTGNALDNLITGNSANNTLTGGAGNDTLNGGAGNDSMLGGAGNDTYIVDSSSDSASESASEGVDLVLASASFTLISANVENLTLTGATAINGTGNALANVLTGNSAANTLNGGAGNDTMAGGAGNDIYVVDSTADVVNENAGEGADLVQSSATFTLGLDVENLTLTGTAAVDATGNSANNVLTGNSANNTLAGGAGADTMIGGAGNDTYIVDDAADTVTELASAGTDLVQASVAHTLGINVENLTLTGTGAITGTGNTLDNVITGNTANNSLSGGAGNDTLNGGAGNDSMAGGLGNDIYVVDNAGDVVTENAAEGTDTVQSGVELTLAVNVENLTLTGSGAINGSGNVLDNVLTGNAAVNTLTGYAGNDTLNGGAGNDTLVGGLGNDTYVVDSASHVVTENLGEGTDTIQSSVTLTALATNVENLTLTGTAAISGTGNALSNVLTGNSAANALNGGDGNDTLNGGAGNDTMTGGTGNDIFVLDSTGDTVTEGLNEGTDTVQASVAHTLLANFENLTLTGTAAINGTGNDLNNSLTGNSAVNVLTGGAGNDTLNGGAGNDNMTGGLGNDIYVVDSALDGVTENAGEGTDTMQSSVTRTLALNVENLTLTGTAAINGTGNTLDNVLTGNSAANTLTGDAGNDTLSGAAGNDTMIGGTGNDTYVVDSAGDVITEGVNEGTDLMQASVTRTLAANVENLTLTGTTAISGTGNGLDNVLTGNSAANTLTGGDGNDMLIGGAGSDNMVGGSGNDTYVVDSTSDVVTENANEGTDLVQASVTHTLLAEVENLTFSGTAAVNGTGNALDNVLIGNTAVNTLTGGAGNDTLNGGVGNDTLVGGTGNDSYVVDSTADVVTENAGEGVDSVQSSVTLTLSNNVENLGLTGISLINGTGNALDNVLTGNGAANVLTGAAGNDTLDGVAGVDTLNGGAGADVYGFGIGHGIDTIQENDATANIKDAVQFQGTLKQADVQFKQAGNNLEVWLNGTSDKLVIQNWYLGSQYHVEEFRFTDSTVLLDTQVQGLVSAMAGFAAPSGGVASSSSMHRTQNHMFSGYVTMPAVM